jgi:peptide/nickel transport system substrate-binding protein
MLNEDVTCESIPGYVRVAGEAPGLEVIDDFTVKFTFPTSNYFFAESMSNMTEIAWPKHFLSEHHPAYNDDADYEQFCADWGELMNGRGKVTLQAWMLDEFVPGDRYTVVRNPYYWKVDPEGNQLPYFDRADVEMVEDRQAVALGNVSGKFDWDGMWVGVQHLQMFMDNILERDYDVGYSDIPGMVMYFNMDVEDPVKRAAYRDVNYRRAFSTAINRDELNELYYNGLLIPAGTAFSPNTPYYQEDYAQRWISGDPEEARAILEEAGYVDVNGDGFVESPDGEPLEAIINVSIHDLYTPSVETIVDQLAAAGIKAIMNAKAQSEIGDLYTERDFEIHVWDADMLDAPLTGSLSNLISANPEDPPWHSQWDETGAFSEKWVEANDILKTATTLPYEERVAAMSEVNDWMSDELWFLHIGYYHRPFIVSNRVGNATRVYTRNSQLADMPAHVPEQLYQKYEPKE